LILLDIDMPIVNGFEVFSWLRKNDATRDIPVIFVTGNDDASTELEAYSLGAVDFILKPYSPEILKRKVDLHINMLDKKRRLQAENSDLLDYNDQLQDYNTELQNMAQMSMQSVLYLEYFITGVITELIEKKDGFSAIHSKRVARYMDVLMGEMIREGKLKINPSETDIIKLAGQLFDMGKIGIPDYLLVKTGKYSDKEFETMKMHTVYASDAVQKYSYLMPNSNFVMYTYQMCRSHHERWDGMGYPDRLAGNNIPILARLISLCDMYDALVSERPYKTAMTHEQAYYVVNQSSGTQLDPDVVAAFNMVHVKFMEISKLPVE
ncbi:MAG: response regulator, partial [Lachnospiraceae bacterium]|nr:response regulator [Lachnospiraceae bacterium]